MVINIQLLIEFRKFDTSNVTGPMQEQQLWLPNILNATGSVFGSKNKVSIVNIQSDLTSHILKTLNGRDF